jgi:hypothetical protein
MRKVVHRKVFTPLTTSAMSTNVVYTTEFLVSNLTTKSVTLGPTSATVVREIQDVQVKVRRILHISILCIVCCARADSFLARSQ